MPNLGMTLIIVCIIEISLNCSYSQHEQSIDRYNIITYYVI